eukprot:scaffold6238_cov104-Isochrysis_galbana.AAC.3
MAALGWRLVRHGVGACDASFSSRSQPPSSQPILPPCAFTPDTHDTSQCCFHPARGGLCNPPRLAILSRHPQPRSAPPPAFAPTPGTAGHTHAGHRCRRELRKAFRLPLWRPILSPEATTGAVLIPNPQPRLSSSKTHLGILRPLSASAVCSGGARHQGCRRAGHVVGAARGRRPEVGNERRAPPTGLELAFPMGTHALLDLIQPDSRNGRLRRGHALGHAPELVAKGVNHLGAEYLDQTVSLEERQPAVFHVAVFHVAERKAGVQRQVQPLERVGVIGVTRRTCGRWWVCRPGKNTSGPRSNLT